MSIGALNSLEAENGTDYMESNCVSDPTKLCDFKSLDGKILKTVDAVYQEVATEQDCKYVQYKPSFPHTFQTFFLYFSLEHKKQLIK